MTSFCEDVGIFKQLLFVDIIKQVTYRDSLMNIPVGIHIRSYDTLCTTDKKGKTMVVMYSCY